MVYAIQLKGVPASEWVPSLDTSGPTGDQMTVGGKQVTGSSQGGFTSVFYTKDDITFMVIAPDADAQAIVAALP